MSAIAARRVAKLEGSLGPQEAVLAWLAEAQQFPTIEALARSIADQSVEAAPLTVIGARVEAATREAMKGRPPDDVRRAVRGAVGDAVFLYCLVLVLNVDAFEVARLEGLRGAATFFWMGCLLGGPHEPPTTEEDARERRDSWRAWCGVVDQLALDTRARTEARASLEARYFGGRDVLFPDAAAAWADYAEQGEHLERLAELLASVKLGGMTPRTRRPAPKLSERERADDLAGWLADSARVKAYELLGERERAVSIMERRLKAEPPPELPGSVTR